MSAAILHEYAFLKIDLLQVPVSLIHYSGNDMTYIYSSARRAA